MTSEFNGSKLRMAAGGPPSPSVNPQPVDPAILAAVTAGAENGAEWHYQEVDTTPQYPITNPRTMETRNIPATEMLIRQLRRCARRLGKAVQITVRPGNTPTTRTVYVKVADRRPRDGRVVTQ